MNTTCYLWIQNGWLRGKNEKSEIRTQKKNDDDDDEIHPNHAS